MERAGAGRYRLIWAAVLPILAWALIRVAGVEGGFPLVPVLAYTPYVAFAALLAAGIAVALRNWAAAAVGALSVACLFSAVLPRAIGSGERIPPGASELRVLSTNVHHGTADPARLVALVRALRPDLFGIQELTPSFAAELERAGLRRLLPETVLSMHHGASGGGLYSRLPLRRLPAPRTEGIAFRMPRAVLILENGDLARVVDVHPYPPKSGLVDLWRTQLASLPAADPTGLPWLLIGDFNSTLDFPQLRDLIDTGYRVEDLPGCDHRAVFARLGVP